jgi:hypothetical protein
MVKDKEEMRERRKRKIDREDEEKFIKSELKGPGR